MDSGGPGDYDMLHVLSSLVQSEIDEKCIESGYCMLKLDEAFVP